MVILKMAGFSAIYGEMQHISTDYYTCTPVLGHPLSYDVGGVYTQETGKITIPKEGYYMLTYSMLLMNISPSGPEPYINFMLNNVAMQIVPLAPGLMGSSVMPCRLNSNDTVKFVIQDAEGCDILPGSLISMNPISELNYKIKEYG